MFVLWNCKEISSNVMWKIRNEADKMEQSNSEKSQKFLVLNDKWLFFYSLTFDSRADFMATYTFNQVRCFFLHLV